MRRLNTCVMLYIHRNIILYMCIFIELHIALSVQMPVRAFSRSLRCRIQCLFCCLFAAMDVVVKASQHVLEKELFYGHLHRYMALLMLPELELNNTELASVKQFVDAELGRKFFYNCPGVPRGFGQYNRCCAYTIVADLRCLGMRYGLACALDWLAIVGLCIYASCSFQH